jgi:hypothetical protein
MKRLLYSMSAASVAAVVALASSSPVGNSDKPTSDPAQNTAENGPNVLDPNASPKEAKGTPTTKVNVDSQGVILRGYDVVAYFKQGKPVQGNPPSRAHIRVPYTYLPRQSIKPILRKILQSMPPATVDFVPTRQLSEN